MNIFYFKLALAIFLLKNSLLITGQSTPQDRCNEVSDGVTANICNSCIESFPCTGGAASVGTLDDTDQKCTAFSLPGTLPTQICDSSASNGALDGVCIDGPNAAFSPICSCSVDGCFPDPNNPELFVNCKGAAVGNIGLTVSATDCADDPNGPLFDQSTCACAALTDICPSCGIMPVFESECTTSYYICAAGASFSCPPETCFNSEMCSCQQVDSQVCSGPCDKYPNSADPTGKGYCICQGVATDPSDDYCDASCSAEAIFDADECGCVQDLSTTITPVSCPECQKIPDTDNEFGYCVCDPSNTNQVCLDCEQAGTKFNVITCACEEDPTACPTCQKKPDPNNRPSGYCICQEGAEDICIEECSEGEIFDSDICDCAQTSTITPDPNSPGSATQEPISGCQSCGLADDPDDDDCSSYFRCNTATGELTTGPYKCPGNLCFDPVLCNCV